MVVKTDVTVCNLQMKKPGFKNELIQNYSYLEVESI